MRFAAAREGAVDKLAQSGNGNGAGKAQPPPPALKAAMRPRDARQLRFAQSFAHIIAVLMRDPNFRRMRLADLEWLVLPPVMAGQFKLAQATSPLGRAKGQEGGVLVPVAVALWARVSAEIDKRLSEDLEKPARLRTSEWASGDNIWLMAAGGDPRAVPKLLEQLAGTVFKEQRVKMRVRGPDDKVVVRTLSPSA